MQRLTDRHPEVSAATLLADMVPPRHFADATFDTYQPAHPTQETALRRARAAAEALAQPPRRSWLGRRPQPEAVYVDGGFGVGKTHLLAAMAHVIGPDASIFGTFVEYTNLVGALGFAPTRDALASRRLVAIDEFELDDPGDTLFITRLVRELTDAGVSVVATSNTLPEALGEGRFAAEDFKREIGALASRFEIVHVDGPDYRQRAGSADIAIVDDATLARAQANVANATSDDFAELGKHLATLHPSRYRELVRGLDLVTITDATTLPDQFAAVRFGVFVDRLYDEDVPVLLTGEPELFSSEMLRGGFRKKYLRAASRLVELTERGRALA